MEQLGRKEKYARVQSLLEEGWTGLDRDIRIHNSDETLRHLLLKATIAKILHDGGRDYATEVELAGRGVVDVLDLGPSDGMAVVYEVETNHNPERVREKVRQYASDVVRDVIVIPARESPENVQEIESWLKANYIVL